MLIFFRKPIIVKNYKTTLPTGGREACCGEEEGGGKKRMRMIAFYSTYVVIIIRFSLNDYFHHTTRVSVITMRTADFKCEPSIYCRYMRTNGQ